MHPNASIGKTDPPADAELAAALGPVKPIWDELLAALARMHGADVHEWNSRSPKWGWSLRVLRKKRTIVWPSPSPGCSTALFMLGEKAMREARAARLPQRVIRILDTAPRCPEGTGVRLAVKSPAALPALRKLAAIKVAN